MDNCFNMECVIHIGGKPLFNLNCNKMPYLKVNLQSLSARTSKIPQKVLFLKTCKTISTKGTILTISKGM